MQFIGNTTIEETPYGFHVIGTRLMEEPHRKKGNGKTESTVTLLAASHLPNTGEWEVDSLVQTGGTGRFHGHVSTRVLTDMLIRLKVSLPERTKYLWRARSKQGFCPTLTEE